MGAFALTFGFDQITKFAALRLLASGPVDLGPIHLHLVANRGIVMGFPAPTLIVILAAIGVAAMALRESRRHGGRTAIAWWVIAGGAFGNLTDRFLQRGLFPPNTVVDWISVGHVTFNLADLLLVVGGALLFCYPRRGAGGGAEAPARVGWGARLPARGAFPRRPRNTRQAAAHQDADGPRVEAEERPQRGNGWPQVSLPRFVYPTMHGTSPDICPQGRYAALGMGAAPAG